MGRLFEGSVPTTHDLVGVVQTAEGRWLIAVSRQQDERWLNFKVTADTPVARKANYWLSADRRKLANGVVWFARSADVGKLREHRPALFDAVSNWLVSWDPGETPLA